MTDNRQPSTVNRQPSTVNDYKECLYNLDAYQLTLTGHKKVIFGVPAIAISPDGQTLISLKITSKTLYLSFT